VSGTFYPALQVILASVHTTLSATPTGWPVGAREYIVPGALAWDECECGLLAIEWLSAPYSQAFPNPSPPTSDGCRPYLALQLQVTSLRCAPNPGPHGEAPSAEALSDAAQTNLNDLEAMLTGVSSAVKFLDDNYMILNYSLSAPQPAGPAGGCVGITQQLYLGFSNRWGAC
jgi:hypothetical protein